MEPARTKNTPSRARVSRRNGPRRWCIPPALQREPDEALEGSQVMDEVPGAVGLVLWQSLRDVTLWATVDPGARAGLFKPDAARRRMTELLSSGAEPALEVSLTSFVALVGAPEMTDPEIVSLVCVQVARWAEGRGWFATAMGYAQAAAFCAPEKAEPALAAGQLALRWRRHARAETWLRRAVGLARRGKEWPFYAQAYVELGTLYTRRGQRPQAQRFLVMGLRAARRHGIALTRGAALHGLFLLALEANALDDGERYARAAMRIYGRGHPRSAELIHDLAYLWVLRGNHGRAVPVLQRLLPSRVEPVERAFTLALLARAGAGAEDARLHRESWMDAWAVITRRPEETEKHGRALLELARASVSAKDWVHAEQAHRLASAAALAPNGDRAIAAQLEPLATAIRTHRV